MYLFLAGMAVPDRTQELRIPGMTTFYLIRHAAHSLLGKRVVGRTPGVRLSPEGRDQARELADRLAGVPLDALYASPLERAQETAEPLAQRRGLAVRTTPEIQELDFGEWSNHTLEELSHDPEGAPFNAFRSGNPAPGGEWMADTQHRFVGFMEALRREHAGQHVALVSHADPIKAALVYYLGMPLDFFLRLEISPASVSIVRIGEWGPKVICINDRSALRSDH